MEGLITQTRIELHRAPLSWKLLITCFLLSLSVGYGVSFLQVRNRTSNGASPGGMSPSGASPLDAKQVVLRYRGSGDPADVVNIPQSDAGMISVAHVHSFSQPVVLMITSVLFLMTTLSEGSKLWVVLFSFLGSLGSVAGPWLVRDVSEKFVFLLFASGAVMSAGFVVMFFAILHSVWLKK